MPNNHICLLWPYSDYHFSYEFSGCDHPIDVVLKPEQDAVEVGWTAYTGKGVRSSAGACKFTTIQGKPCYDFSQLTQVNLCSLPNSCVHFPTCIENSTNTLTSVLLKVQLVCMTNDLQELQYHIENVKLA